MPFVVKRAAYNGSNTVIAQHDQRLLRRCEAHSVIDLPGVRVRCRHASIEAPSIDVGADPGWGKTFSIEGTIEGELWWSNSLSLAISLARSGEFGSGAPIAIRKRSPISAQMARECSSLI